MNITEIITAIEQCNSEGQDITAIAAATQSLLDTGKTPLGLNQWKLTDKPRMEEFNEDNRIIDEQLRELESIKVNTSKWISFTPSIYGGSTAGNPILEQQTGAYKLIDDTCIYSFGLRVANMLSAGMEGILLLKMPVPYVGADLPAAVNAGSLPANAIGATLSASGILGYINTSGTGYRITADLIKTNRFTVHGQIAYRYQ